MNENWERLKALLAETNEVVKNLNKETESIKQVINMTWDDIYDRADDCAYGSDELIAKDEAQGEQRYGRV